jgi:hypothetical protein
MYSQVIAMPLIPSLRKEDQSETIGNLLCLRTAPDTQEVHLLYIVQVRYSRYKTSWIVFHRLPLNNSSLSSVIAWHLHLPPFCTFMHIAVDIDACVLECAESKNMESISSSSTMNCLKLGLMENGLIS